MAGWIDLGRVMALPKGEYSAETTYEINDYVTFNRGAFICRKACKGVEPVVGQTTEYWQEFGPALKPATFYEAGIVKPDSTSFNVKQDGTIKPALSVRYNKETKELYITDIFFNPIGNAAIIDSSAVADVEFDTETSTLYLIDDEGQHIGNGAHLEISGGAGVLTVDWETYLASKETYDSMDMIIVCEDAPGSIDSKDIAYDNTETEIEATNAQDAIDYIIKNGVKSSKVILSQAQYDELPDTKFTDNVDYYIYDATDKANASNIECTPAEGYEATNVQGFIGEITSNVSSLSENLTSKLITVATTDWVDFENETYTKKATILDSDYTENTMPQYIDLVPFDGSAFFSEAETEAKGLLNQGIVFGNGTVTFYASDIPTCDLKFRIGGK